MDTTNRTFRRLVPGNAIPTLFGMALVASLIAITVAVPLTAEAQGFQAAEAVVRARVLEGRFNALIGEWQAAKAACSRAKAGGVATRATIVKLEARVSALEAELSRNGCAAFDAPAEKRECLAAIVRIAAETTQAGLATVLHLNSGTFPKSRKTRVSTANGVSTTDTTEEAGILPVVTGAPRRCFDFVGISAGTAETPASIQRIDCHDDVLPPEYEGRPNVPTPTAPTPPDGTWPRWAKVTVAVVSGIVILGGVGALIGSGLDENSFDPNTGEKDNGRDRATLLGGGISAAVSLAITIPLGFSF